MSNLKKKTFAIAGAALVLVTVTGSVATMYAKAATKVNTYTVSKGDMEQVIELNGTIESADSVTFFAETNLKVKDVKVKEGDAVKKGDILVTFDESEIENAISLANLEAKASAGGYDNAIQTSDQCNKLYSEASKNLNTLNRQISDTEEAIFNKQKEISARSSYLANEGAKIQVELINWSDRPDSDEYKNLLKLAQNNAYQQVYDEELLRLQGELSRLNVQLGDFKEYKALMESQKASSYLSVLTDGAKSQLEANKEANEITVNSTIEKYENAKKGIVAEFDGIVTGISASEGSYVSAGTPVITVDSSEDIIIRCYANKYDIISIEEGQTAEMTIMNEEYTGRVSRVERKAGMDQASSTGVGVDVLLDSADDIILGLEVKAKVNTASVADAISVPKDAIISENANDYVFIVRDKKAVKTKVETGIKNDDYVEIISGINSGDIIAWNDEKELKNGEEVRY